MRAVLVWYHSKNETEFMYIVPWKYGWRPRLRLWERSILPEWNWNVIPLGSINDSWLLGKPYSNSTMILDLFFSTTSHSSPHANQQYGKFGQAARHSVSSTVKRPRVTNSGQPSTSTFASCSQCTTYSFSSIIYIYKYPLCWINGFRFCTMWYLKR